MMLRALVVALMVVGAGAPVNAAPAVGGPPVVVPVITSTTGYLAFLGKQQAVALRILEKVVNEQQGGIHGHPVHFDVQDDSSSPQIAVQLMAKVVAEKSPALIGPQTTGGCNAVLPMAISSNGPIMYCLSPALQPPANSFGFVSNVNTNDDAVGMIRYFRLRGWTKIAFLVTTDAAGQSLDKGIASALALPENHLVQSVAYEHFAVQDISIAAQLAKIKSANPQAIVAWCTGTPLGLVLRSLRDAGVDLPLATGTGNMTYAQMTEYATIMPSELYFPSVRAMTRDSTGAGPIRDAQLTYFAAFQAAGARPDFASNLIWDPALIVIDALRHLPTTASADDVRRYIIGLHSFFGINGLYDFRDGSQRGLGIGAVIMDRWDKSKSDFVAVSRAGAYPK